MFDLENKMSWNDPTQSPGVWIKASKDGLTFITVPDCVKVHVVLVVGEEEEAEPGVEGVDGNDEKDSDNMTLLPGWAIETEVHVDLGHTEAILIFS